MTNDYAYYYGSRVGQAAVRYAMSSGVRAQLWLDDQRRHAADCYSAASYDYIDDGISDAIEGILI